MKNNIWMHVISILAVFILANSTNAVAVLFDFEDLAINDGPEELGQYMTGLYSSSVTVADGIVHNTGLLGDDKYIHGCIAEPHIISIYFDVTPIASASFDWAAEMDEFNAYADGAGEPFFHQEYSWSGVSGQSGIIIFDSPVNHLMFSDGGQLGQIEVDNLLVTQIPEPAMVALLGLGVLAILRKQNR